MRLFQQPLSPYWFVEFRCPETGSKVRRSTKERNKRPALAVAPSIVAEYGKSLTASKARLAAADGAVTIRDAMERYCVALERARKPSARTVRGYVRKTLGDMKGRYGLEGSRPIATLTPADMEDLATARADEGNSPQTIAHELQALRAAVNHAAALGFTYPDKMMVRGNNNPWRIPDVAQKTRYLSQEEWSAVYAYLAPERPITARSRTGRPYVLPSAPETIRGRQDIQDMFVALTMTGGRWSEVATLTWDRIDRVTFSTIRIYGSKTKQERLVPVPDILAEILRRRYPARTSALVFPGKHGSDPRSQHARTQMIKAMDACGLNRPETVDVHGKATVHSLRHTCASWLIQAGAGLSEVKDVLGHSSLDMTLRYAHLSKGETVAKMAKILDSTLSTND